MDGEPTWLPSDWEVRVRVRTSGKKDKYYINPSNGLKFNSKPEVLRYLKNAEKELKPKELNTIDFKTNVAEKLPPGWIKEIRTKRKNRKTRRDPCYIDPVTGRHFCSMQEVNRYLENENSGNSELSTTGANGQKFIDKKLHKIFTGNESIMSGSEGTAVENTNPLVTNSLKHGEKENDSVAEDGQQEKVAAQNKRTKSNNKWMNGLPRRTSKRLAGVEADPPLEVKTSIGATEESRLRDEAEVNTNENIDETKTRSSGDFGKPKETISLRIIDPSSVEEHENSSVDIKEDEKNEKHLDPLLNELLMDPCIEFAIKTLTGAIPIEDINKIHDSPAASLISPNQTSISSSVLHFGDIWDVPCFEFAVKMLTSEIPMEDSSCLQISFQQPLSSSGASGCNSSNK